MSERGGVKRIAKRVRVRDEDCSGGYGGGTFCTKV